MTYCLFILYLSPLHGYSVLISQLSIAVFYPASPRILQTDALVHHSSEDMEATAIHTKLGRGTVWVFGKLHNNQRQVKTLKLCLTSQPYAFIKYTGGLFHIRVTIAQARKTELNTAWKPSRPTREALFIR